MLGRHPLGSTVIRDACVVDEDIDAVPTAEDFDHGGRNLARFGDIAFTREDFYTGRSRLSGNVGQTNLVDIDEKECNAFLSKPQCDRAADAGSSARDQRLLATDFTHDHFLM